MALPINVNKLINGRTVEWERLEFKKSWNPVSTMRSICAFANDLNDWGGGYIIIGIEEERGKPVLPPAGISSSQFDPIQKELLNICYRIQPNYTPVTEPVQYMGREVFVIWVPGGDNRPYKAPQTMEKGTPLIYWVRKGSSTVRASPQNEQLLIELASKIPFDDRVNHTATVEALDKELIK